MISVPYGWREGAVPLAHEHAAAGAPPSSRATTEGGSSAASDLGSMFAIRLSSYETQ
jgi:hypothetical protein